MDSPVLPWSRRPLSPSPSFPGRIGSKCHSQRAVACPVPLCSVSLLRQERGGDSEGFLTGSVSFLSFLFSFPPGGAPCVDHPALGTGLELGIKAESGGVLGASSRMRQDKELQRLM